MVKKPKSGGPYVQGISAMKATLHFSPLNKEHLEAIGHVTTAWNLLEGITEAGVWGFGSFSQVQGRLITYRVDIKKLLKLQSISSLR
jgi:hypothetical protein